MDSVWQWIPRATLVSRDADVLSEIAAQMPALVKFSITTADPALAARLEPGAPSPERRFAAMEQLAKAGVFTGCCSCRCCPAHRTTGRTSPGLLRQTAEAGGRFCYCWPGLTMREGQREYFYQALDREFPGLREKYEKRYGTRYRCTVPGAAKLYAWVREECSRLGLLSEMEAIIAVSRQGYDFGGPAGVRQACIHRALVRAGTHGRRASFYKGRAFLWGSFPQMRGRRVEKCPLPVPAEDFRGWNLAIPGERAKIGELKNYPFNGMDRRDYLCNCF